MRRSIARPGFTLIELLVVISIIVMLISILLPALGQARESSRLVACQAAMRGFGTVAIVYDQEYKQFPHSDSNSNRLHTMDIEAYNALMRTYGMSKNFSRCPASDPSWAYAAQDRMTYQYFAGTADYTAGPNVNGWRTNAGRWAGAAAGWYPQISALKEDPKAITPTFLADLAYPYNTDPFALPTVFPQRSNHARRGDWTADGNNHLFLDGHVEYHKLQTGVAWSIAADAYQRLWWSPRTSKYVPHAGSVYWP